MQRKSAAEKPPRASGEEPTELTEIANALRAHRYAYQIVIALHHLPPTLQHLLEPKSIGTLTNPQTCGEWLKKQSRDLGKEISPRPEDLPLVANLVRSILESSFQIEESEILPGRTVRRVIRRRPPKIKGKASQPVENALRHALSRSGTDIDREAATHLLSIPDLQADCHIVAYAWELRQRAAGKSKGRVNHLMWKNIPREVRTDLDENTVWLARSRIIDAIDQLDHMQARTDASPESPNTRQQK